MNRRNFLAGMGAAAVLYGRPASGGLKIGVTDWNLQLTCKPEAIGVAKRLGFDGVQISIGRKVVDGKMPLDDPGLIAQYRAESQKQAMPIDSTCLDRLHDDCLKASGSEAQKRVADGIRITK